MIRRGDTIKIGPIEVKVTFVKHWEDGDVCEVHVFYRGREDNAGLGTNWSVPAARLEALRDELSEDWKLVHSDTWLALHSDDQNTDTF